MKDITLIHIPSDGFVESDLVADGSHASPLPSILSQVKNHGLSYDLLTRDVKDIPESVDSSLVVFVDDSYLVQSDYIFNAVSINNLFRDMGIVFGPVSVSSRSNKYQKYIEKSYHKYGLDFFNQTHISDINKEYHNYGTLRNAIISGAAYNRIKFSPLHTSKSTILDNPIFFKDISRHYKCYYSSNLNRLKVLSEVEFDQSVLSEYYYNLGFCEGVIDSNLEDSSRRRAAWQKFVESPELIDLTNPRLLFECDPDANNLEYLEALVVLKCKHQLGYFEGFSGRKIA